MKCAPIAHSEPTNSRLSNLSDTQSSIRLRGSLSTSSSGKSLDNTGDRGDRGRLCDAVLNATFSAATQNVRLEGLEAKAAEVDQQMNEVKVELAEAEAQEAVQCVKWREKYMAEANEANIHREKAELAEARLQSSAMVAAEVSAEHLQVECLRTEVVERGAHWAVERERLLDEIYQLKVTVAEREGCAAAYELQVQKASEQAAQVTVERCNEMEALAHARAEAGRAISRSEASEAARALAEEKRLRATASVESMKVQLQKIVQNEENAVMSARKGATSEDEAARQARKELEELRKQAEQNREAVERLHALEEERRRDAQAAVGLHADARLALENLFSFVGKRENNSEGSVENLREIEEQFLAESKATQAAENAAIAAAQLEARKAAASEKHCELLRGELTAQSRVQKDLHNELQALSSAAAAVRAVAVAKDEKILELQASSRIMLAELAISASPKGKGSDQSRERSGNSPGSVSTEKAIPHTPFDVMSNASTLTTPWESALSKAGESTSSTSTSALKGMDENMQPPLAQVAAFLNAAAARAAAAASAVEGVMPLISPTQNASNDTTSVQSAPSVAGSDAPSRTASTQNDETSSISRKGSVLSAEQRNGSSSGPSWEAAQVAMTEQIRKDISLLRKALAASGMTGTNMDDEVKEALLRATEAMGIKCDSESQGSHSQEPTKGQPLLQQLSPQGGVFRSTSPLRSNTGTQPGRHYQQIRPKFAASVEPTRQAQQPELFAQRSRSDSRTKSPPKVDSFSHAALEHSREMAGSTEVKSQDSAKSQSQTHKNVGLSPQVTQLGYGRVLNPSNSGSQLPLGFVRSLQQQQSPSSATREVPQAVQRQVPGRSPDGRLIQSRLNGPMKESADLRTVSAPQSVPTPQGGRFNTLSSKVAYGPNRAGSPTLPKNPVQRLQSRVDT